MLLLGAAGISYAARKGGDETSTDATAEGDVVVDDSTAPEAVDEGQTDTVVEEGGETLYEMNSSSLNLASLN